MRAVALLIAQLYTYAFCTHALNTPAELLEGWYMRAVALFGEHGREHHTQREARAVVASTGHLHVLLLCHHGATRVWRGFPCCARCLLRQPNPVARNLCACMQALLRSASSSSLLAGSLHLCMLCHQIEFQSPVNVNLCLQVLLRRA